MSTKTHYRKAFDSPYLSSADIVGPTPLTISHVALESDKSKKTKDLLNTAYFVEKEIRQGEKLKPMILNATNSKMLKKLTGTPFLEDWKNVPVTVYVEQNIKFGRETVDGLRLINQIAQKAEITPEKTKMWDNAKAAFKRDGNFLAVLERASISEENQKLIIQQISGEEEKSKESIQQQATSEGESNA